MNDGSVKGCIMTNFELIILFAFMITFIITLAGWIFTYRSQRKTQQAISKLAEQMQDMMEHVRKEDAPKYSDSSTLLLSANEQYLRQLGRRRVYINGMNRA